MIALIDGDILLYRIGFSTENESESIAKVRMSEYISEILNGSGAGDYRVFLSPTDKSNFRYSLYKEYKGNRSQPKPKWYHALREFLVDVESAEVAVSQEADDQLGIEQTKYYDNNETSIICSIDKDLLQIPGWHYNFVKQRLLNVSPELGLYNFYMQLLTGDSTDNIPGLDRIGPVSAKKILKGCSSVEDYNRAILQAYKNEHIYCNEQEVIDHINMVGKLLYIRKYPNEVWSF